MPILLLVIGIIAGAAAASFFLHRTQGSDPLVRQDSASELTRTHSETALKDGSQQRYDLSTEASNELRESAPRVQGENATDASNATLLQQNESMTTVETGAADKQSSTTSEQSIQQNPAGRSPSEAESAIKSFYLYLDEQQYIKELHFDSTSQEYLSGLIQKMLDSPPVVSGETNDLFTILQNTSHFFRVIGRQNMVAMRSILAHEKKSYEELFADFYSISRQPDALREAFSINLNEDALYDYGGFFLTTMGGRLYLFRRDSSLRMLVTYYSILIVDNAIKEGRNRHGIDLRPIIDNLINEIENSGNQLQLKEQYLDNLYTLKEKYQQ